MTLDDCYFSVVVFLELGYLIDLSTGSISYCTRERVLALGVSQLPFLNRNLLGHYSVYHPYVLPQAHGTTLGHFTIWTAQTNHTQPTVS